MLKVLYWLYEDDDNSEGRAIEGVTVAILKESTLIVNFPHSCQFIENVKFVWIEGLTK